MLAIVFAPGATPADTSFVEPADLAAAVLAPTTLELAVTRTVAPRHTGLLALRLSAAAVFALALALALSNWSRRRRELQAAFAATPADARPPHRRGPPLLTV